jgi:hypothetical protein
VAAWISPPLGDTAGAICWDAGAKVRDGDNTSKCTGKTDGPSDAIPVPLPPAALTLDAGHHLFR